MNWQRRKYLMHLSFKQVNYSFYKNWPCFFTEFLKIKSLFISTIDIHSKIFKLLLLNLFLFQKEGLFFIYENYI